jgi:DNA-binding transcriptional MerR regulator
MSKETPMSPFDKTVSEVARGAEIHDTSVRNYANAGLLPTRRLANGIRLFQVEAIEQARAIHAEHMANKGRKRA